MEEAVFIEGLLGQFGVSEVPRTHVASLLLIHPSHSHAYADFAAADARLAPVLRVGVQVLHVRNILQTHVTAGHGTTHVTDGVVKCVLDQRRCRCLRSAVSFDHLIAQHAAKEAEDFRGERRGARDGDEHAVEAYGLFDLAEDEGVVEPVGVVAASKTGGLGLNAAVE